MTNYIKTLLSIFAILFLIFTTIACSSNESNIGKYENVGYIKTVSICRNCGLVVEYSYDRLFPDNSTIHESCNNWEGHLWYNAGTSGHNAFTCNTCGVKISIAEKKPRCLKFCEEACIGKFNHDWRKLN